MNKTKLFISIFTIIVITALFTSTCFADNTSYVWSNINNSTTSTSSTPNTTSLNEENSTQTPSSNQTDNFLNLQSGSAILVEQTTGKILYSHNIHEQLRPASVTKLMSILLIMEQLDNGKLSLDDQIPCSENASSMGGSQIWLDPRETLSVHDMLKAICVNSANDCVYALAEYIAGSESAFVDMMNNKAKELGMNDTVFKNCHGLDEDGHVTSSYDISLMSCELLNKHPEVTEYTSIWMDSLRNGKSELVNTNKLIRNYSGATGLKTGSTSLALYNLSASATRDGLSLIAVVMKAPTSSIRFNEASTLLDYGFNNFSFKQFAKKGDILKTIDVNKGVCSTVDAVFATDGGSLVEKGQDSNITQNIVVPDSITAPIYEGQKLGEVTYSLNDKVIATADIVAKSNVEKINIFNMTVNIVSSWFSLFRN